MRRIGHQRRRARRARNLAALHRAHLDAIPFENLDIVLGRGITVDLESVQGKLVDARRGGYCYEHGLLFAAALERLGYRVDRLLARVGGGDHRPRSADPHGAARPRGRRAVARRRRLRLGPARAAAVRRRAAARQGGWEFALAAVGPRAWELRERRHGEWITRYGFDDQRQHPADVVVANHFTSTWPSSPFVTRSVVVRKDEHALRELIDRTLTVTRPDGSTEQRPARRRRSRRRARRDLPDSR